MQRGRLRRTQMPLLGETRPAGRFCRRLRGAMYRDAGEEIPHFKRFFTVPASIFPKSRLCAAAFQWYNKNVYLFDRNDWFFGGIS